MKDDFTKRIINQIYAKLLKRKPTEYEAYIYEVAIKSGLSKNNLESILKQGSEYNYVNNIKKNIIHKNNNINYDKKIAICLSGHARNLNITCGNIIKNLILPLKADVFIHTWDTIGKQAPRNDSVGIGYSEQKLNTEILNLINKLKPKSMQIDNFKYQFNKFKIPDPVFMYGAPVDGKSVVNSTARPENIISQLYSIHKSYKLLEEYELKNGYNYDIIIKMRFDFIPDSGISKENMEDCISNKSTIYTLDKNKSSSSFNNCNLCKKNFHNDQHDSIISDLFLFGQKEVMKKYMSLYLNYLDLYTEITKNVKTEDFKFCYSHNNIKFIDNIDTATYLVPCFFPERLLMSYLSEIRVLDADIYGQVVR